jgi:hypothetical protein
MELNLPLDFKEFLKLLNGKGVKNNPLLTSTGGSKLSTCNLQTFNLKLGT